jgi:hypothetical protein
MSKVYIFSILGAVEVKSIHFVYTWSSGGQQYAIFLYLEGQKYAIFLYLELWRSKVCNFSILGVRVKSMNFFYTWC